MNLAIRDDDTNFFTTPDDLIEAYADIWDRVPITLFVVPFMMGNWKSWIYERHFNYQNLDFNKYNLDKKIYPIGDNKELVSFLKEKSEKGCIEIAMHGIHHRNLDLNIPYFKNNRGENAEFFTDRDLTSQLSESKRYLEELFEIDIKVFSPPQNLLSHRGYWSVVNNNLNLVYNRSPLFFCRNVNDLGVFNSSVLFYSALVEKLNCRNASGLNGFTKANNIIELLHKPLQPSTNIDNLIKEVMKNMQNSLQVFVLSTHYFAFQQYFDPSRSLKKNLIKLLDIFFQNNDCKYYTISEMIDNL